MKKEVSRQEAPNPIPQAVIPEKKEAGEDLINGTPSFTGRTLNGKFKENHQITGVILTELETLKLQNFAKDIQIYQLQAQQVLGQKQTELQRQIEDLKVKYNLDGGWEINPEGTKFVKVDKPEIL